MYCPRDATSLLRVRVDAIELDKCPNCHGIWLDRGELELLEDLRLTHIEAKIEESAANSEHPSGELRGYMRCPVCPDGRLQRTACTYTNPVHIDRCDVCLGVWVDATELTAIVDEKRQLEDDYSLLHLAESLHADANASGDS